MPTLPQAPAIHGNVYGVAWAAGETPESGGAIPTQPVLFFKTRNTYLPSGGKVLLPANVPAVECNVMLGLVLGRDIRCATAAEALSAVAGYVLAIDVAEPAPVLRPPIREKCRDTFLPHGAIIDAADTPLDSLQLQLEVDGVSSGELTLQGQVETIAATMEAVTSFMTLRAGDVLLAARIMPVPMVSAGSTVVVTSPQLGRLECSVEPEGEVSR